jgi:predicted nucleic acid-binding protein
VLLEFHAVVTDARRFERPIHPADAWSQVEALTAAIPVLDVPGTVVDVASELVRRYAPVGGDVFDVFLVAQMVAHGISTICTEDVRGFARFAGDGVDAVRPADLLES